MSSLDAGVEPLRVGGLRTRPGLCLLRLESGIAQERALASVLGLLAARRINLCFLAQWREAERVVASFAVEAGEGDLAREAVLRFPAMAERLQSVAPVAALSVYPHHHRLELLGRVLRGLAGAGVPVLAVASSISAVTFALPESGLPTAVASLQGAVVLPPGHTPIAQQLRHRVVPRGEES